MPNDSPLLILPRHLTRLRIAVLLVLWLVSEPMPARALPAARPVPPGENSESTVSFGVWLAALTSLLDTTPAPAIETEYAQFATTHGYSADDPQLTQDYRRVRLLFEAVRDGGFWHLRWDITNQEPSSRMVWKAWIQKGVRGAFEEPSATAECDESSALFGMLARHIHIANVGLFYPTWNHTIAVWAPLAGRTRKPLVQLPTTQIFLSCDAGFNNTTFRTDLKNIERYPNWDVHKNTLIPRPRAEWLLHQVQVYAPASPALWSLMRAKRAAVMGSSMGTCKAARAAWYDQVLTRMTLGDVSALNALAKEELNVKVSSPSQVLAWLKD
jgi:hypothetical protein